MRSHSSTEQSWQQVMNALARAGVHEDLVRVFAEMRVIDQGESIALVAPNAEVKRLAEQALRSNLERVIRDVMPQALAVRVIVTEAGDKPERLQPSAAENIRSDLKAVWTTEIAQKSDVSRLIQQYVGLEARLKAEGHALSPADIEEFSQEILQIKGLVSIILDSPFSHWEKTPFRVIGGLLSRNSPSVEQSLAELETKFAEALGRISPEGQQEAILRLSHRLGIGFNLSSGASVARLAATPRMRWVERPKEWRRGKEYRSPSQFILDQYADLYEQGLLDEQALGESDPELLKAYKERVYAYKAEKLPKLTTSLTPTEQEIAREAPGIPREKIKRWGLALVQQDRRRQPT